MTLGLVVVSATLPATVRAASVTVTPATVVPGSVVTFAGSGFAATARGTLRVGPTAGLAIATDRGGSWRRRVRMPADARTGTRRVLGQVGVQRVAAIVALARRSRRLSALAAVSSGERVLLSRNRGTVGLRLRLRGWGFAPGARVGVRFGATPLKRPRVDGAGRFSALARVPPAGPGQRFVIVRAGRARLALAFRVSARRPVAAAAPATPPPPPPPPVASPVIAAAGDIACAPGDSSYKAGLGTTTACRHAAVSDMLLATPLAAILLLGDAQYEAGRLGDFRAAYDPTWGRLNAIVHPAPGNHEYNTSGARDYFTYFAAAAGPDQRGYYSYDVGPWHLVSLNSNCADVSCAAGSPQERWLREDLAAHRVPCTLAYWHHPRFSSGDHGDDSGTDPLWQALYEAGADVVLTGHDHDYERFAPQTPAGKADPARGIRQFVVGTGGKGHRAFKSPKPNSEVRDAVAFGALLLTLRPSGYGWRFAALPGQAFTDAGSQDCHA